MEGRERKESRRKNNDDYNVIRKGEKEERRSSLNGCSRMHYVI